MDYFRCSRIPVETFLNDGAYLAFQLNVRFLSAGPEINQGPTLTNKYVLKYVWQLPLDQQLITGDVRKYLADEKRAAMINRAGEVERGERRHEREKRKE